MARLHEHQGKALLRAAGVPVPAGAVARSPDDARRIAAELNRPVVLKIQAWTTGRKSIGGVAFADSPPDAASAAARLLNLTVGAFPVEALLVEERLDIRRELFVSLIIDDALRAPLILLSTSGGSGVEDRAQDLARIPVSHAGVPDADAMSRALAPLPDPHRAPVADAIRRIAALARSVEARSLEVNPLALTADGRAVAADCRIAIDDYAVFRHPDLGIDIARELDHPPTPLERIAYRIENADHRGTFFFAVLPRSPGRLVGFHGAGGGGSMMSLDALANAGFSPANFTDTSGNPSSAKVYAAARIILAQPGLLGYFGSGSGVASQEQHWSAYGLAKAFLELGLDIPAVIRLGGNSEDRAVQILRDACRSLPAPIEGYTKDDPPAAIASRFRDLVDASTSRPWDPAAHPRRVPPYVGAPSSASFDLRFGKGEWSGRVWIDLPRCDPDTTTLLVAHSDGVLRADAGRPALAIPPDEAQSRDSELIACEIECLRAGRPVLFVDLPIPGLDDGGPR